MIRPLSPRSRVARLFISQDRIHQLTAEERVTLDGDCLDIPALGARFQLRPAVHFVKVVSDEGDTHALVGRVKTDVQLKELGAELMENSVILGEAAYECELGFVGEVLATATGAATRQQSG
jgi:hypothetical protein